MRIVRLIIFALLALCLGTAQAAESDDWSTFSRVLSLVQGFMRIAADNTGDAKRMEKHVDSLLAGRNPEANKLVEEAFADMPVEQRIQVLSLARQLISLSQRQAFVERRHTEESTVIQARKDLSAMGLSYFDRRQFLDAVKRNDMVAVRLYLAGRGVDPRGGLEAAKSAGLAEMAQLLAEALPARR